MIRTHLDDAARDRLTSLRRTDLPTKARDRVEMVALSDAGWSPPDIAAHLGYCAHTVRGLLKDFAARGTDALYPRHTGPAPDTARRARVTDALRRLLAEDRTWTSRLLSASLTDRASPSARARSVATWRGSTPDTAARRPPSPTSRTRPRSRGPRRCSGG